MTDTVEHAAAGGSITAESSSRFADLSPYRIRHHDAGSGHPIVLLHGSGPGATGWSNFHLTLPALARTNRVLAVDMPGWGRSDTQTVEGGQDHPANLVALLDHLGIEKAALVGNSMGGMTSIMTAVRYPDRVSHLVTMGSPAPGPDLFAPAGPPEGLKVLLAAYQDPSPRRIKELVSIMCYDQAWATDELAQLRSDATLSRPDHVAGFADQPAALAVFQEFDPSLPGITAPTLVVHGRDDRVVGYEAALRLVGAIPDSRLLLLNRCGHWAMIEHADEFARAVARFVADHPVTGR